MFGCDINDGIVQKTTNRKTYKRKGATKKMSLKSNRKKPNKDKIWKKNQNYPQKIKKMIRTKFDIERWNWENKSIKTSCKTKTNSN